MYHGIVKISLVIALFVLVPGCGRQRPVSAQDVLGAFRTAGLPAENATSMAPAWRDTFHFREWVAFTLPETGNRGGMLVLCDTMSDCDKIFLSLYHDTRDATAKPYFIQSHDGAVLLRLSGTLDRTTAARYEQVIKNLP